MSAKQGQRYRIIAPVATEGGRLPKRNGQVIITDRYLSKFTQADGTSTELIDLVGDVINASEHVDYPAGKNRDYRHVRWIDEHPDRFELIEDVPQETEQPEETN